jgi:hypothetical protein
MHAIVILKQVDALNGADRNLDGQHASTVQKCICALHTRIYHEDLHHCAFSFYIEELLPLPGFYIEGSNL